MSITCYGLTDGTNGRTIINGMVVRDYPVYLCGITGDPGVISPRSTQQVLDRIHTALQKAETDKAKAADSPGLASGHADVRGAQRGVERLRQSAAPHNLLDHPRRDFQRSILNRDHKHHVLTIMATALLTLWKQEKAYIPSLPYFVTCEKTMDSGLYYGVAYCPFIMVQ